MQPLKYRIYRHVRINLCMRLVWIENGFVALEANNWQWIGRESVFRQDFVLTDTVWEG